MEPALSPYTMHGHQQAQQHRRKPPGCAQQSHRPLCHSAGPACIFYQNLVTLMVIVPLIFQWTPPGPIATAYVDLRSKECAWIECGRSPTEAAERPPSSARDEMKPANGPQHDATGQWRHTGAGCKSQPRAVAHLWGLVHLTVAHLPRARLGTDRWRDQRTGVLTTGAT